VAILEDEAESRQRTCVAILEGQTETTCVAIVQGQAETRQGTTCVAILEGQKETRWGANCVAILEGRLGWLLRGRRGGWRAMRRGSPNLLEKGGRAHRSALPIADTC
jgi:hypothetical protein